MSTHKIKHFVTQGGPRTGGIWQEFRSWVPVAEARREDLITAVQSDGDREAHAVLVARYGQFDADYYVKKLGFANIDELFAVRSAARKEREATRDEVAV